MTKRKYYGQICSRVGQHFVPHNYPDYYFYAYFPVFLVDEVSCFSVNLNSYKWSHLKLIRFCTFFSLDIPLMIAVGAKTNSSNAAESSVIFNSVAYIC